MAEDHDVLVTDGLFIYDRHFSAMKQAGLNPERLDEPKASTSTLIQNLSGKRGYILGGTESVTDEVVAAADSLEVIVFTGAGYREYIPGHSLATERGIAIANTPGTNADAVAEYTIALILLMTREIPTIGRTGSQNFSTVTALADSTVGIIGLGNVGMAVAAKLRGLGVRSLQYSSRRRKYALEPLYDMHSVDLDTLLSTSDIVTIHAASYQEDPILSSNHLARMKPGSLLVNAAFPEAVHQASLRSELESGRIRAAFDGPPTVGMDDIPLSNWFCSNTQTAYNTRSALDFTSDIATESLIDILTGNPCQNVVNPEYARYANKQD